MDSIIITAAVIIAVIAIIEVVTLFASVPPEHSPAYLTVLPVFGDDESFGQRLEYLMRKSCGRRDIILVNYSATAEQEELCRRFIANEPDAVYISRNEAELYFCKIFTGSPKNENPEV